MLFVSYLDRTKNKRGCLELMLRSVLGDTIGSILGYTLSAVIIGLLIKYFNKEKVTWKQTIIGIILLSVGFIVINMYVFPRF